MAWYTKLILFEFLPGHLPILQFWTESPTQSEPPPDAAGLSHDRATVPSPHVSEQVLQSENPPLT